MAKARSRLWRHRLEGSRPIAPGFDLTSHGDPTQRVLVVVNPDSLTGEQITLSELVDKVADELRRRQQRAVQSPDPGIPIS